MHALFRYRIRHSKGKIRRAALCDTSFCWAFNFRGKSVRFRMQNRLRPDTAARASAIHAVFIQIKNAVPDENLPSGTKLVPKELCDIFKI